MRVDTTSRYAHTADTVANPGELGPRRGAKSDLGRGNLLLVRRTPIQPVEDSVLTPAGSHSWMNREDEGFHAGFICAETLVQNDARRWKL